MTDSPRARLGNVAPARVFRLGAEPPEFAAMSSITTAAERVELVSVLTRRAWELSRKPFPSLPRNKWPVVVIRPS
ncbi:MAG: hypothetical protein P3A28_07530 [Gemmatimonadota bacterium]|nr:hypothetical protein [Gemmatimonadota bacterium]